VVSPKLRSDDEIILLYFLQGEDEAMFQDYRKELRVIFNNIGALDSVILLGTVHDIISTTLSRWQTTEFEDVEIAITLLYQLGEALPVRKNVDFFCGLSQFEIVETIQGLNDLGIESPADQSNDCGFKFR